MTIEKAIDVLRSIELYLCSGNPIWKTDLIKEAIKMACEALRQTDIQQTEKTCDNCGQDRHLCKYCIEEDRMWTPQTDCEACELDGKANVCKICRASNYKPQTDCPWK